VVDVPRSRGWLQSPLLVATWASGAGTIIEPLTERPGSEVHVVSVEAASVTGRREVDLVFSYSLVLSNFVERRVIVCSTGGCTSPVRLQRSTPQGEVLWTATVGFPSPNLLVYERGSKVNRALLNPSLWLDR